MQAGLKDLERLNYCTPLYTYLYHTTQYNLCTTMKIIMDIDMMDGFARILGLPSCVSDGLA